jgi:hypothetical protein
MNTSPAALKALLSRGAVVVRARLPSGPCWVCLVAVGAPRRGVAWATVRAAGVTLTLSLDALEEVVAATR